MSPKLPRITAREMRRALHRAGWYETAQVGLHLALRHPARPGKVTVSIHAGDIFAPKTVQSILSRDGLTIDELRDRL